MNVSIFFLFENSEFCITLNNTFSFVLENTSTYDELKSERYARFFLSSKYQQMLYCFNRMLFLYSLIHNSLIHYLTYPYP